MNESQSPLGKSIPCSVCQFIMALAVNLLFAADVVLNVLSLGKPPETLSHRFARLRETGGKYSFIGTRVCSVLTRIFGRGQDHCTWALNGVGTDGTELWKWSK